MQPQKNTLSQKSSLENNKKQDNTIQKQETEQKIQNQQQPQQQKIISNPSSSSTHPITYPNLSSFTAKTRSLLNSELASQKQSFLQLASSKSIQQIQQQGAGLSNMLVVGSNQGLYGRIVLTLVKSYHSQKNPVPISEVCKLAVGDDVALYNFGGGTGNTHVGNMIGEGVVYRRGSQKIKITVNVGKDDQQEVDYKDMKVNIVLKWNQVTYKRYYSILQKLENPHIDIPLQNLFFPQTAKGYRAKKPQKIQLPATSNLNQQQKLAISQGLIQQAHLIHGPPGTGKTTTVCQLIAQAALVKGQKILACAPSNIAVDNIVQGIAKKGVKCVRIGNPVRMINSVLQHCLQYLIDSKQNSWKGEQKKINAALKKLKRTKIKAQRKQIYGQVKALRQQIRNQQEVIIEEILSDANVICCTNVGADDRVFKKYIGSKKFDLVVIDQCGQGLEISCWIPLSRGKRVVLAGDHKQLPPTVKFQQNSLLSYTLFSRCMEQLTYLTSTMLQVQYRMNRSIMGWSNQQFYDGRLKAHQSVQNHTIKGIYKGFQDEKNEGEGADDGAVLVWIDTAGCQVGEEGGQMESKMNIGEADIVTHVYKKLMSYGVQSKDVAILTPYSKQVTTIKNILSQSLSTPSSNLPQPTIPSLPEISTVDGIQGRQKQCIIVSLVRSNPENEIGFLKDWRRMNVAVTRARRMLVLVGDSDCVCSEERIGRLYKWVEDNGVVRSAGELKQNVNIRFGLGRVVEPGDRIEKKQIKKQKKQKQKKTAQKSKKQSTNEKTQPQASLKQHTFEQQQNLKQKYKSLLKNLREQIIFENLNAYERKMMHQVAGQFGFSHVTSQDKSRITVKPTKTKDINEIEKQQEQQQQKPKTIKQKVAYKKQFRPQNMKQLIGDQSSQQQQVIQKQKQQKMYQKIEQPQTKQPPKPKKSKKQKKQPQPQQSQQEMQKILDQFLSQMPKNDQCYKCKKKISSVTAIQCQYCKYFYCRHDVLAEQHGCEDAARQHARRPNLDKYLEQGARKIKQKIKQQEDQRKKKQKDKDGKQKKK